MTKSLHTTKPRRPTVAFALRCLESDEELILLSMLPLKDWSDGLRLDKVPEYRITQVRKLIKQGEGMGYKAKPWQEVKEILLKYR